MLDAIYDLLSGIGDYIVTVAKFTLDAVRAIPQFFNVYGKFVEQISLVKEFFPTSVWVSIAGILTFVLALATFRLITRLT